MATLVEDIEPPGSGQTGLPHRTARLDILPDGLDATGGFRRVIVIDSAENLLKDGHVLRDSELDLALETVQGRPNPLVKIVFVTQHVPEATAGVAWTEKAVHISLSGLKPTSLREHFAVLDPSDAYGLAALPENDLRRVHGRLACIRRLAELLSAVISSDPPGLQVNEVGPSCPPCRERGASTPGAHVRRPTSRRAAAVRRASSARYSAVPKPSSASWSRYALPWVEPAASARSSGSRPGAPGRRWYLRKSEIDVVLAAWPLMTCGGRERAADPARPSAASSGGVAEHAEGRRRRPQHSRPARALRARRRLAPAGLYDCAYSVIESMEDLVDRWAAGPSCGPSGSRVCLSVTIGKARW